MNIKATRWNPSLMITTESYKGNQVEPSLMITTWSQEKINNQYLDSKGELERSISSIYQEDVKKIEYT